MAVSAEEYGLKRDDHIPARSKELWIVRVTAGLPIDVVGIAPAIWGIWTHWGGSSSEACFENRENCPGCKRGLPRRWKGYLHCLQVNNHLECFIEVSPVCARDLMDRLETGKTLRGTYLTFTREAKNKKGRLYVRIHTNRGDHLNLGLAKDPTAVLTKLWGLSDEPLHPAG